MRPKRRTKNIKETQWNTLNKEVINEPNYNKKSMPVARAEFKYTTRKNYQKIHWLLFSIFTSLYLFKTLKKK